MYNVMSCYAKLCNAMWWNATGMLSSGIKSGGMWRVECGMVPKDMMSCSVMPHGAMACGVMAFGVMACGMMISCEISYN